LKALSVVKSRLMSFSTSGMVHAIYKGSRVQHGKYQLFYVATAEHGGDPTKIKNPTPKSKPSGDHPTTNTHQDPLLNHNFFYTTMASINPLLVINTTKGVSIPIGLINVSTGKF
jgi:hypothetical protein